MGLLAADLQVEGVRSFRLPVDDELGPDHSHVGNFSESPDPELHPFGALGGEYELVSAPVVYGQGLDAFAVAAVVELGETEAADVFSVDCPVVKLSVLGVRLVEKQGLGVEEIMEQSFDGESEVEHADGVIEEHESLRFVDEVDFDKFPQSQQHSGSLLPLLGQGPALDVLVGKDIPVLVDEIQVRCDVIGEIATPEQ